MTRPGRVAPVVLRGPGTTTGYGAGTGALPVFPERRSVIVSVEPSPGRRSVPGRMRTEHVGDHLMRRITSGDWPLNSQIPTESALSETLGVGRSTVREAVRSLVRMGMLETARGRGTFVRATSPVNTVLSQYLQAHSAADILELRRAVEVEAAGLAARRRTETDLTAMEQALDRAERSQVEGSRSDRVPGTFHRLFVAAAHNPLLDEVYAGLLGALQQAATDGRVRIAPGRADAAPGEHRDLLHALRGGEVGRARTVIARHTDAEFQTLDDEASSSVPESHPDN